MKFSFILSVFCFLTLGQMAFGTDSEADNLEAAHFLRVTSQPSSPTVDYGKPLYELLTHSTNQVEHYGEQEEEAAVSWCSTRTKTNLKVLGITAAGLAMLAGSIWYIIYDCKQNPISMNSSWLCVSSGNDTAEYPPPIGRNVMNITK